MQKHNYDMPGGMPFPAPVKATDHCGYMRSGQVKPVKSSNSPSSSDDDYTAAMVMSFCGGALVIFCLMFVLSA